MNHQVVKVIILYIQNSIDFKFLSSWMGIICQAEVFSDFWVFFLFTQNRGSWCLNHHMDFDPTGEVLAPPELITPALTHVHPPLVPYLSTITYKQISVIPKPTIRYNKHPFHPFYLLGSSSLRIAWFVTASEVAVMFDLEGLMSPITWIVLLIDWVIPMHDSQHFL